MTESAAPQPTAAPVETEKPTAKVEEEEEEEEEDDDEEEEDSEDDEDEDEEESSEESESESEDEMTPAQRGREKIMVGCAESRYLVVNWIYICHVFKMTTEA